MATRGGARVSKVDVNDKQFGEALKRRVRELEVEQEQDILRLALDVERRAKALVPVGDPPVHLRDGISHKQGRDERGYYVDVGSPGRRRTYFGGRADLFYDRFVEYGTKNMAARPFMRPALAQAVADYVRRRTK